MAPTVQTRALRRAYGPRVALAGLDLELQEGELFGLLGPNGAGKSTTLNLLMGFLRPTSGSAQILGLDCTRDAVALKARVGHLPEEPSLYDNLTGRELLAFVLRMRGLDASPSWRHALGLAERLDLARDLDELVASYSMGTRKKLALVLAMAHKPPVLLLDEPTNGLDPAVARAARDLLTEHTSAGGTVVLSTHLLDVAQRVCHRVAILAGGALRALGSPDAVRAASTGESSSLEDAFLALVGPSPGSAPAP